MLVEISAKLMTLASTLRMNGILIPPLSSNTQTCEPKCFISEHNDDYSSLFMYHILSIIN